MSELGRIPLGRHRGGVPIWVAVWQWVMSPMHFRLVRRLRIAAETGDTEELRRLLAPDVSIVVEAAEGAPGGARVVVGTIDSMLLLIHGMRARRGLEVTARSVNGQAGLLVSRDGKPSALVAVDVVGRFVSVVWVRLDPELLRHGNRV
jgi:RNA polymerase sigma-70 factor (ECF subfamily)